MRECSTQVRQVTGSPDERQSILTERNRSEYFYGWSSLHLSESERQSLGRAPQIPRVHSLAIESQIASVDQLPLFSVRSGYLQEINHSALVSAASETGAQICVPFRPGQFVLEGEALATV